MNIPKDVILIFLFNQGIYPRHFRMNGINQYIFEYSHREFLLVDKKFYWDLYIDCNEYGWDRLFGFNFENLKEFNLEKILKEELDLNGDN